MAAFIDNPEITLLPTLSAPELRHWFRNNGFTVEREFYFSDVVYAPHNLPLPQPTSKNLTPDELRAFLNFLEQSYLLRCYEDHGKPYFKVIKKTKLYDENGDILAETKDELATFSNRNQAHTYLDVLGYRPVAEVLDCTTVFVKDDLHLALKEVPSLAPGGFYTPHLYIEIEGPALPTSLDAPDFKEKVTAARQALIDTVQRISVPHVRGRYYNKKLVVALTELEYEYNVPRA